MTGKALYYLNTQDEQGNYNKEKTDDASKAQAIPYKSADPKISGGFTNIISYKWFDLGLTFTYSLGGYSFDKTGTLIETDGSKENHTTCLYMLWTVGRSREIELMFPVLYWNRSRTTKFIPLYSQYRPHPPQEPDTWFHTSWQMGTKGIDRECTCLLLWK